VDLKPVEWGKKRQGGVRESEKSKQRSREREREKERGKEKECAT